MNLSLIKHLVFSLESSSLPTFWILSKLHGLCESCRRNSLETNKRVKRIKE